MPNTAAQVEEFIARYSPVVAEEFRAARAWVSARFPRGYELVFDNYTALGCGFSTKPRGSGVVVSVVAYPRWVTLFFFQGASLPDPQKVLQGPGRKIRSLRLQPFALLRSREVDALLKHAIRPFSKDLAAGPPLTTVIRAVSAKRRPRRPAVAKARKGTSSGEPGLQGKPRRIAMDLRGMTGEVEILRVSGAVKRDAAVDAWFSRGPVELRAVARKWFQQLRSCGDDVLELIHDGCPVVCVEDAPFAYVNTYKNHVNIGFFLGAFLEDPAGLLAGAGKRMRHVKTGADHELNEAAMGELIHAACGDIRARLERQ
jgi:hypothetical protein